VKARRGHHEVVVGVGPVGEVHGVASKRATSGPHADAAVLEVVEQLAVQRGVLLRELVLGGRGSVRSWRNRHRHAQEPRSTSPAAQRSAASPG